MKRTILFAALLMLLPCAATSAQCANGVCQQPVRQVARAAVNVVERVADPVVHAVVAVAQVPANVVCHIQENRAERQACQPARVASQCNCAPRKILTWRPLAGRRCN